MLTCKDTNPKDSVGIKKVPMSPVSVPVMMEVGLAMLEGALKYGRHNYRVSGVRASVYYDALMRHIGAWWEGEDMDPGTKGRIHHITKCISTLTVLRDSMIKGNWVDDRPPKLPQGFVDEYNAIAASLIDEVPEPKKAFTECEIIQKNEILTGRGESPSLPEKTTCYGLKQNTSGL